MTTSDYFSVKLPSTLTDEQLTKVYTWGKTNCLRSNMLMQRDGYLMVAQKSDKKDLRCRQRLMGTNLKNWGVDIAKQKGWMSLLTEDEYEALSQGKHLPSAKHESPRGDEATERSDIEAEPVLRTSARPACYDAMEARPTYLTLPPCLLSIRVPAIKSK